MRGGTSQAQPVRDFYDTYYNAVDRMNQDYHAHYYARNWSGGPQWALHSALFYFLNSTRYLWEEHRVCHQQAQHGGHFHESVLPDPVSFPDFLLDCVESLDQ